MAPTPSELQALRELLNTPETPELGPGPRASIRSLAYLNENLERLFHHTTMPSVRQELLRCVVLLWHDHHEAAHEICQQIETSDGSWLHGLLHRRDPDYGNARYWFRRVGAHPVFPTLAGKAAIANNNNFGMVAGVGRVAPRAPSWVWPGPARTE